MDFADKVIEELWFEQDDDAATVEAAESLAAKLAEVDGLKTFPIVAQKILTLLGSPDFKVQEVAAALKEDPSLAAGVLRMANSAFFAGAQKVASIDQAFVRLGSQSVREVIAAVATMDLFPDSGGVGKRVRDHCAATAAIGQFLAREFSARHRDGIFLAGLMHDVGKMLFIESGEIDYAAQGIETMRANRAHTDERSLLGYDHAVLGGHVLSRWKLPQPIPRIVAWHHQPSRAYADDEIRPYVALLRVADQIDSIITAKSPHQADQIEQLARSEDCAKLWLTATDLQNRLESIVDTRSTSLKMFGG